MIYYPQYLAHDFSSPPSPSVLSLFPFRPLLSHSFLLLPLPLSPPSSSSLFLPVLLALSFLLLPPSLLPPTPPFSPSSLPLALLLPPPCSALFPPSSPLFCSLSSLLSSVLLSFLPLFPISPLFCSLSCLSPGLLSFLFLLCSALFPSASPPFYSLSSLPLLQLQF